MKYILSKYIFFTFIVLIPDSFCQSDDFFIRLNQVGFLPGDLKSGVIISEQEVPYSEFEIIDQKSDLSSYTGKIQRSNYSYGKFDNCYSFNFSDFDSPGEYIIKIKDNTSYPFQIGEAVNNQVIDSLMLFFRIQRCGPTDPLLHQKCHLSDATKVIGLSADTSIDVTGGWHDAGDYIKFFSTAALTTYMLLFSYEFDNKKFGFDNDQNNVPDILEEAKVGLDWLLRCNFSDTLFVTQVQDEKDHKVRWRLPEDDSLRFDRPGFTGMGKNLIGVFSAVMALASRIWSEKFLDYDFSNKLLTAGIQKYSIRNNVPDVDSNYSAFYNDKNYFGKLALGAMELYLTTGENQYLDEALALGDSAKSDHWWSWGDVNSLAHYKIARLESRFSDYIKLNLLNFNAKKDSSVFNEAANYTWGTTTAFLGAGLQAILYKTLTRSDQFDSLMTLQRDYILGRNPWGISFINGIGERFPSHLHSQVAFFNNGYLPGALSAGASSISIINKYKIERSDSTYSFSNSESVQYFDDWNDYITNEPTIFGNATALFVFGYFSERE